MIGRRISHYLLEERLGSGGMGVVYLARDLALGRKAALKLLPEGFAPQLKDYFLREARACARLQHPAIATFYETGEADGQAFIAMEYVRGQTLRARLRSGPLPVRPALAMVSSLLEALGHAHAAGILHRDIKPENVMLCGDRPAKLLDFGLARPLGGDEAGSELTRLTYVTGPGLVVGTPAYMAPERLRGEPGGTASDLFAVGAVLYEALSGKLALRVGTEGEPGQTMPAGPPALQGAGWPEGLSAVLERALAADPLVRYESASKFLGDLRRLGEEVEDSGLPQTLAVLDLQNLSGDSADAWLGSGIAESLHTALAPVPGLELLPREKVLKARVATASQGGDASALAVGQRLGCRWVLSGSYQRMGPAVRVTMQLTEVPAERVLAAEKFDGTLEKIFDIQDRLCAAAMRSLPIETPTPRPAAPVPELAAYEAYARGMRFWFRLEKGSFDQAREFFEKAVEIDPTFAAPFAGLAAVHAMRFTFTTDARELELAAHYAKRAIELDPRTSDGHVFLGYARWRQGDPQGARELWMRAMELDPRNARAPYFAGCVAMLVSGQPEAPLELLQRAVELDPTFGFSWLALGSAHFELGHAEDALWCLDKAIELESMTGASPTAGVAGYRGEFLRRLGRLTEARAACMAGLEAVEKTDHMYRDTFRCVCLLALGRTALEQGDRAGAQAAFTQVVEHVRGRPRTLGGGFAVVQALAGLARAGDAAAAPAFDQALGYFERREGGDFSTLWVTTEDVTLLELSRAAQATGRDAEARALLERARQAGPGWVLRAPA